MPPPISNPDRFVPIRGDAALGDRFRSIKDPRELSSSERLVRTDSFAPDAFVSSARRTAMLAASPRRVSRSDGADRRVGELHDPNTQPIYNSFTAQYLFWKRTDVWSST